MEPTGTMCGQHLFDWHREIHRLSLFFGIPARSCEICQSAKHGGTAGSVGTRRLYAGRPWQVVAVDLVGPMPETPRGNRWILVLTDHFTRWQDALAIADATAGETF